MTGGTMPNDNPIKTPEGDRYEFDSFARTLVGQGPSVDSGRSAECDWKIPGDGDEGNLAFRVMHAVTQAAREAVQQAAPDLADLFPMTRHAQFQAHFDPAGWFVLRLVFEHGFSMPVGPAMDEADRAFVKAKLEPFVVRPPEAVFDLLGPDWFAANRFTYAGPCSGRRVSWRHIRHFLLWWLGAIAASVVLEHNRQRVLRAVPPPPSYDIARLHEALWVLECEEDCIQGTAFGLEGVGLVTCNHCLGSETRAFRANDPGRKWPVEVLARHPVVDLAVLRVPTGARTLTAGSPAALEVMDHLLVAGHPNYRLGDTPVTVPGLVVGFRPVSGIRRVLTNAAIVAGCSGGPVLDGSGAVIGVAVTGSQTFGEAGATEDHGIIPIDALGLLTGAPCRPQYARTAG